MSIVINNRSTKDKRRSIETGASLFTLLTACCAPVSQTVYELSAGYGNSDGINDVRLQMEKPGRSPPSGDATRRIARSTDSGA